jgi:hypothetical protein
MVHALLLVDDKRLSLMCMEANGLFAHMALVLSDQVLTVKISSHILFLQ